jgi:hypothetical protein
LVEHARIISWSTAAYRISKALDLDYAVAAPTVQAAAARAGWVETHPVTGCKGMRETRVPDMVRMHQLTNGRRLIAPPVARESQRADLALASAAP